VPADPWLVLAAGAVEAVTGYPQRLHARLPHPVTWIAGALRGLEGRLNRGGALARRLAGVATLALVAGGAALAGYGFDRLLAGPAWGAALVAVIGSLGLAARNLHDHAAVVDRALAAGDLVAARDAVGRIVGRDTAQLDEAGVTAAALESLAESFNDGVLAPLCWFLAGGLAGLFAYKAVNTADSLIGHRDDRHRWFGWAAARTDDVMNLIPARLAGGLIALAGGRGWRVMWRDAGQHASPNAGWPEAAMAGALGVRLGGPVAYDGEACDRRVLGDAGPPAPADLRRGLTIYRRALALAALALLAGGFAWPR
jgi:adenosylcobinamide-phosphate synthase